MYVVEGCWVCGWVALHEEAGERFVGEGRLRSGAHLFVGAG